MVHLYHDIAQQVVQVDHPRPVCRVTAITFRTDPPSSESLPELPLQLRFIAMATTCDLPIGAHSIICSKCTSLITELVTCPGCNDTIPLVSTFAPDIFLSRKCNAGLATRADVAAVRAHVASAKQLLRTYDFLVGTLERSATQVYRLIKHYSSCIKRGVKTLPPELLSLVFQFAVAGRYNSVFANGDVEMESPSTAISQVCQNWRRIALRTPTLWRDISLQAAPNWIRSYTENRVARMEIMNLYIKRAQSMQLNIKVGMKGGVHADIASEDYESEFGGFGIMLHSYWHRVSSLHIHSFVPTSIVLPLSHLGEITVDGIPPHYLYDDLGFNTSGALPALRKLVVPQLPSTIFSGPSVLGITSLTIQYVSFDTLFSSSKWWDRVPRLEELVIEWFKGDVPTLPFRSLKLFTLRHLRIRSRGKDIPPSFHGLDLFEVPKLQSLEICPSKRHDLYHPDINDSSPPDDVVDPYSCLNFSLRSPLCTSLSLDDIVISPAQLHETLAKLPNLRQLKLGQIFYTCEEPRYIDKHMWKFSNVWHYRASVGNQFFAMLTEINPKTLVPLHLQNLLELDIETPSTGLDAKVFLQFLRIRLYGVQRLTRAEVLFQYQSLPQSLIRELGIVTRRFIEENRDGALVIRHQIPKTTFREDQHSGKLITRRVLLT